MKCSLKHYYLVGSVLDKSLGALSWASVLVVQDVLLTEHPWSESVNLSTL